MEQLRAYPIPVSLPQECQGDNQGELLRHWFAFVQIGLEQRLHLFEAVLDDGKSGDGPETVQTDQGIDAGVEWIDAQKAFDKTVVHRADVVINLEQLFQAPIRLFSVPVPKILGE